MSAKSRESIYRASIRASAERAKEARRGADRLACEAWNQRMLGYRDQHNPSPALDDPLNAGYRYLEVRFLCCDTHQTVALDIVRQPMTTPIHVCVWRTVTGEGSARLWLMKSIILRLSMSS